MLIFLITSSFSLTLLYSSIPLKNPLSSWTREMKFLLPCFLNNISLPPIPKFIPRKKNLISEPEILDTYPEISVLDLPDPVLESILKKLPPHDLCRMANACAYAREKCSSDHLWREHMEVKWGAIIGREYEKGAGFFGSGMSEGNSKIGYCYLIGLWSAFIGSSFISSVFKKVDDLLPQVESIMACYLGLESGKLWFPAQVYNRENGNVGFLLSCYDAMVRYDRRTNTFSARYVEHGTRPSTIESGVTWDRLRAPPVDTSPHDLHVSDCLNDLRSGDQIEIQWRRNKEFPYGWWYGVVGHLETCDGNAGYCQCPENDTLVLEFNQYTRDSRWRRTLVNKRDYREKGNEADGFYGGIRKICGHKEILTWKKLCPAGKSI